MQRRRSRRGVALALAAALAAVTLALMMMACGPLTVQAQDDHPTDQQRYDSFRACSGRSEHDPCYHPDVEDKCLGKAYCQYEQYGTYSMYGVRFKPLKCVPGSSKCDEENEDRHDSCQVTVCRETKCISYPMRDGYECDTDSNKCTVERCYEGKCLMDDNLRCKSEASDFADEQCIKHEGYCDPKQGCVAPEYYQDGYECDADYNKCTMESCYEGKCQKADEDHKCDTGYKHYDGMCVERWGYCDPKEGCVGPEFRPKGYGCDTVGLKCTEGECDGYGRCQLKEDECVRKYDGSAGKEEDAKKYDGEEEVIKKYNDDEVKHGDDKDQQNNGGVRSNKYSDHKDEVKHHHDDVKYTDEEDAKEPC